MRSLTLTASLLAPLAGCITIAPSDGDGDAGADTGPELPVTALQCSDFTADDFACGGDPVGRWTITRACLAPAAFDPLAGTCPGLEVEGEGSATGELELVGDSTYSLALDSQRARFDFAFPLECYGGATEPCRGDNFGGDCEVVVDRCECQVETTEAPLEEFGDWTRYYDTLSMYPLDLDSYTSTFCKVDPDTLLWVRFAPDPTLPTWAFVLTRASGEP